MKPSHYARLQAFKKTLLRAVFVIPLLPTLSTGAIADDDIAIGDIFRSELACRLIEPVFADMPVAPVFAMEGGACVATVPENNADYFTDAACTEPLAYQQTTLRDHCAVLLDNTGLGETTNDSVNWTLPPGTRIDVGARPLTGVSQPYMQERLYREITTDRGTCRLAMRVYKSHPTASEERPLLALHGGSWSARGFGFFGLEFTVPHFVAEGFTVYAPFYRLIDEKEGSPACHLADIEEVVSDASAALDWIQAESASYGDTGTPVVFGQSAGAHLAARLLLDRPDDVAGGVLFYPPTDFTDFVLRIRNGRYDNPTGLDILDSVIANDAASADLNATPIPENSLPIRIVEGGLQLPPMFLLHGVVDDLVEARQSVRLCDALAGRALIEAEQSISELSRLREVLSCGDDSTLQLIQQGQHALDVCIESTIIPTDLCLSGNEASRIEVANAIGDAARFANTLTALPPGTGTEEPMHEESSSGGGGRFSWLSLGILILLSSCKRLARCGQTRRENRPGR